MVLKDGDDVVEALNDGPVHAHAQRRGGHLTLGSSELNRETNQPSDFNAIWKNREKKTQIHSNIKGTDSRDFQSRG